jgi:hypothetical protein
VWGGGEPYLVGRGSRMPKTYLQSSRIDLALEFIESESPPSRGLGVVRREVWCDLNPEI